MQKVLFLDRKTQKVKEEKISGKFFLEFCYSPNWFSCLMYHVILPFFVKIPFFSHLYGHLQKTRKSCKKIKPFVKHFEVDVSEFSEPIENFNSFNDFFIRTLKPSARSFDVDPNIAVLPADGRHLFFQNIRKADGFYVKGKKFDLSTLLLDDKRVKWYEEGSLVISRLCPVDYHRFHFPFDCLPSESQLINGPLYSVNPIALRKNIRILSENKRVVTELDTKAFGTVLFIEVGATFVGSIKQTFLPHKQIKKGEEKGYFEFGGSCLLMLFKPHRIQFDEDLLLASEKQLEVYAKMGERFGIALN